MTGYEASYKLIRALEGEAKLKGISFSDNKEELRWDMTFKNLLEHILIEINSKDDILNKAEKSK